MARTFIPAGNTVAVQRDLEFLRTIVQEALEAPGPRAPGDRASMAETLALFRRGIETARRGLPHVMPPLRKKFAAELRASTDALARIEEAMKGWPGATLQGSTFANSDRA